jgi:ABC-2 type transport system ATP-binding protein
VQAVSNLSFEIQEGQLVGFLGANGAGKTTTLKMIMGLIHPSAGEINLFGKSHKDISVREQIGFLTERPYFYDYLTGFEFLKFISQLFSKEIPVSKLHELLEKVGLGEAKDRQLRKYSKGMLQRVGIAQALLNDPKLLIFDEPMSGLDPDGRIELMDIIRDCHKGGATILFSTHILNDVEVLCNQVVMVDKGRLLVHSSVQDLLKQHSGKNLQDVFVQLKKGSSS